MNKVWKLEVTGYNGTVTMFNEVSLYSTRELAETALAAVRKKNEDLASPGFRASYSGPTEVSIFTKESEVSILNDFNKIQTKPTMAKEMTIKEALKTYKVGGEFYNRYGWRAPYHRDIFGDAQIGDKFISREGVVCEYMGTKEVRVTFDGKLYTAIRHVLKHPNNRCYLPHFSNGRYDVGYIPYDIIAKQTWIQ